LKRLPNALAIIAGAIAAAIAPPTERTPSALAAEVLIQAEGPRAGQLWDPSLTPYVPAIIDEAMCGAHTKGVVRKSAQTGFSEGLKACVSWIALESPCRALLTQPTTGMAMKFNRDKLAPAIEASPALKRRIYPLSKKGTLGSSALYKAFPGGSVAIIGANSAAELQMHTVKIALCDEVDQYPRDLDGQGSPMSMIDARQISFHATRDYRKLIGGTPTIKGESLVDAEFEAGDQRYWKMPCPHCGERIKFVFGGYADQTGTGLRFNRQHPVEAHYVPQCCGVVIEHWQKADMVRAGAFEPEAPAPGRYPSWHLDAMMSLLTTWDHIAEKFIAAGDDPQKLKSFYNHDLGLAYEEDQGETPDWQALFKRREQLAERIIPADGLIVTAGVDVQKLGLYLEILAWTPDRRSYTLLASYIRAGTVEKPGDTSDPDDPCWKRLTEIFEQPLQDEAGNARRIDAMGIDCRYNAPVVYDWVRRHHGSFALRTEDGWGRVPLGNPQQVDFDWRGKRIKRGALQWKVGSYNLKSRFYAYLRREVEIIDGVSRCQPGFCHFGSFLPEGYFRQLCSEYVALDKKGHRIWKQREDDNHYLDCRVLNMALAFGGPLFDIENRSPEFWRARAIELGLTPDHLAPLLSIVDERAPEVTPAAALPQTPAGDDAWIPPSEDWL